MTVAELIEELEMITDKTKIVNYIGWNTVIELDGGILPHQVIYFRGVIEYEGSVEIHD